VQCLLMHRGKLASGGADCTVRLWDPDKQWQQLNVLSLPVSMPHAKPTATCCLEQTDAGLWSAHQGGSINIWDAEAGTMLRNLEKAHDGPVWALQRMAGVPELLASAGADGMVKLWDARQVKPAGQVQTGNAAYALATGQDVLISAGYDGCIRLWEARAGTARIAASLQAHRAPIRSLLVENGTICSGSSDGTVRCWDLGQLLVPKPKQAPGFASAQAVEDYIASGIIEKDAAETDDTSMVY